MATEIREARERLGMTQEALAKLCEVDVRTARRWETGETAAPSAVLKLLQTMEAK